MMTIRKRVHFPMCRNSLTKERMKLYHHVLKIGSIAYKVVWPGTLCTRGTIARKENLFIIRRAEDSEYAATLEDYKYVLLKRIRGKYISVIVTEFDRFFKKYKFTMSSMRRNIMKIEVPRLKLNEMLPCFPSCFFTSEKSLETSTKKRKSRYKSRLNKPPSENLSTFKGWLVQCDAPNRLIPSSTSRLSARDDFVKEYISRNSDVILEPFLQELFATKKKQNV
jgi:hypothetical protein